MLFWRSTYSGAEFEMRHTFGSILCFEGNVVTFVSVMKEATNSASESWTTTHYIIQQMKDKVCPSAYLRCSGCYDFIHQFVIIKKVKR